MNCDNLRSASHGAQASGSVTDDAFRIEGVVRSEDDLGYTYPIEMAKGATAELTISGVPYDLSRGSVVLEAFAGGDPDASQLNLDLGEVEPSS